VNRDWNMGDYIMFSGWIITGIGILLMACGR
jgi:hypothetical protein